MGQVADDSRGKEHGFRAFYAGASQTVRGAAMKSFGLKTGRELRICKPNSLGASLKRDLKKKSRLT